MTTTAAGSDTMIGTVDYDVAVYLGSFRNLDLLYRGLYIIQASLLVVDSCVGQQAVAPVTGMSSCPSHLESSVGDRRISLCAVPISSELDDRSQCWRSRSLLVRYLDEQYELSDGIYWKLSVPGVTLNSDSICNGLDHTELQLKFELLCCPLEQDDGDGTVPQRPTFTTVATQDLLIRRPGSGIHAYHPITFDGIFIAHVDCMVHVAIASLRFADLMFEADMEDVVEDDDVVGTVHSEVRSVCNESRPSSCAQPPPSMYQRMMEVVVVRPPPIPGSDPLSAFMRRMSLNRPTVGSNEHTSKGALARSTPSPSSIRTTDTPSFDCAEGRLQWVHPYVESAVVNRSLFAAGIRMLIGAAAQREPMMLALVDELADDFLLQSSATVVLLGDVARASSAAIATKMLLKAYMDRSNALLSASWATLLAYLRGTIPMLAATMKHRHADAARIFWRGQAVFRTVRLHSDGDKAVVGVSTNAFRRELRVCDRLLEENMDKLPQLLIEQYIMDEPAGSDDDVDDDAQPGGLPEKGSAMTTLQSLKTLRIGALQSMARTGYLLDELRNRYPARWREREDAAAVTGPSMLDCSMSCSDDEAAAVPSDGSHCREQGGDDTAAVPAIDTNVEGLVSSSLSRLQSSVVTTRMTYTPFIAESGESISISSVVAVRPVLHLVVLQHGFLGCGTDMGLLNNALRMEEQLSSSSSSSSSSSQQQIQVFIPTSNEGREGDGIAQMGNRLAVELLDFCRTSAPSLLELNGQARVSFIGHSLGGVVIRWALQEPMIQPLLRNVHAFISLASPHVGTLFAESQLVSAGMRALFQFKKYKSLQELVLEDAPEGQPCDSLLYRLSQNGVLRHFKKVVLVSSPADRYVPSYSARAQKITTSNSATGKIVSRMVDHLLEGLRPDQLVRITIDNICSLTPSAGVDALQYFPIKINGASSVNDWIGRTAHICYLDNAPVAKALVSNLAVFFS